jgi:dTDP-4-amino-4,6-dideoxygalactose transaminase/acetyltransferase-like isoleucine patch superfamily enzyme
VENLNCLTDVKLGREVKLYNFLNLYGCTIGDQTSIGAFVEIQRNAMIGKRCKISSHSFICEGVLIEDEVFIGHNVTFINDRIPRATLNGQPQTTADWSVLPTQVKAGASIGSGATILGGVTIGKGALVGAGAVVTRDVPDYALAYGNPARIQGRVPDAPLEPEPESLTAIPFSDLCAITALVEPGFRVRLDRILATSRFIQGETVQEFERDFAQILGAEHVVGCNSGTSALHLALRIAGVGPGDEVILPAMSFIATAWPVVYLGATPIFCDIDPNTYALDLHSVAEKLTEHTKAILPVHLYGQAADMAPLLELASQHSIPVIEDAAQAHLASYQGNTIGTISPLTCFSFYPGKNLGAAGEAGALVCKNPEDAALGRMLRDHGQRQRYLHEVVGYNYRMDELQAAFLVAKLPYLADWTLKRQAAALCYQELLADLPLKLPTVAADRNHVFHLFVIQTAQRDRLWEHLQQQQIYCGLHYPIPLHQQLCFSHLCSASMGSLPQAEKLAQHCLSLPLFPGITQGQQQRVAAAIHDFWS